MSRLAPLVSVVLVVSTGVARADEPPKSTGNDRADEPPPNSTRNDRADEPYPGVDRTDEPLPVTPGIAHTKTQLPSTRLARADTQPTLPPRSLRDAELVTRAQLPFPKKKTLLDAYLVSVAATVGPAVASGLILGDDARGIPATVGGVIATTALLVGPSTGHWYAGGRILTTGLAIRLSAVAVVGGILLYDQWKPVDEVGGLIVGGIAVVGLWEAGVIWDAATLPRAVRRYNREHTRPVIVAPFATDRTAGVAVAGRF